METTPTINCKGKIVSLKMPMIMGILNITPDSFFDGNKYNTVETAVARAVQMYAEGATIIDVGGQSTKPNSNRLSAEEELQRVLPIIEAIHQANPDIILSIDTYFSEVAEAAIQAGVGLINDVTAASDERMFALAKQYSVPIVLMHNPTEVDNLHRVVSYENLLEDIIVYFKKKITLTQQYKVHDVILDVGIGFSKTIAQNFELIKHLEAFKLFGKPLLTGISRKSFIYKTLKTTAQEALNATSFLHAFALQNGSNILRVHDVKAAKECVDLYEAYRMV